MDRAARWRAQGNRVVVAVALLVLLPLVAVVEHLRRGAGQSLVRRGVAGVARLCGIRFEVRMGNGSEPPHPAIYTPTHRSPVDIPAMLLARPALRFLAASDLFRIPLLATAMRALRTVPIDRRHPDVAHRQLDVLIDGHDHDDDLVIFPEGGIAPTSEGLPFKTGAYALAIQTGTPIVPVAIHGARGILPPGRFLAVRPGTVVVELLEPIDPSGLTLEDRGTLRDRAEAVVAAALAHGPPALTLGPGRTEESRPSTPG